MRTQHTPGPWEIVADGSFLTKIRSTAPNGNKGRGIANTYVQNMAKTYEGNLAQAKINEANARLIASAPDLLEALQLIVKWDDSGLELTDALIEKARAAISKATGGQS